MNMILLFHIAIALTSLVVTAYAFVSPARRTLHISYVLIALTIMSGTYLAVTSPAHIVQACVSGLIYTAVALSGVTAAHRKLGLERG